jgi:hypothetical protein
MINILQIENGKHICGDINCEECCHGYPAKCQCGGLIHAEHLGSHAVTRDNPFGIKCLCDKCGGRFMRVFRNNRGVRNRALHNSRPNQSNQHRGR